MTESGLTTVRRAGLAEQVAEHLLAEIATGVYPAGEQLPPEPTLAERTGVSRLTLREAVKELRQRGVVRVQQGRGTFVNPPEEWSAFDSAVLNARAAGEQGYELAHELTELRRIVERGIAELAAHRRTDDDLSAMESALARMRAAWETSDLDAFSVADIDFHDALLRAAGNTFALTLFRSVDPALRTVRRRTAGNRYLAERALMFHTRIIDAVRRRAFRSAASLMDEHLKETEDFTAQLATAHGDGDVQAVRTGGDDHRP